MDCIFCKIIEGDIPSYKIYEDDVVYAFLDITQATKGHTLIVPKKHVKNVYELSDDLASEVFKRVPHIAKALKKAFKPIGLNIINNNDQPHQSVFHFHIHLIPRYEDDGMTLSTINHQESLKNEDYIKIQKAIKTVMSVNND